MTRRDLLRTLGAASLSGPAALALPPQERRYDLLIKNGEVRDPSRGLRQQADVAVLGSKIAAIEPNIPADRGIDVIDAKRLYVTPGIVDLHTHIHYGLDLGIHADPVAARSGTTTWVDAGTFSYGHIPGFRRFIVEPAQVRIFGFVYLYPRLRNPDADPIDYVRRMMRPTGEAVLANRDIILGVKFQAGANMQGRYSLPFLKIARELCDEYQLRLMCHSGVAPPETDDVMELMRPSDVITHCYNSRMSGVAYKPWTGILDDAGKLKASVRAARERGVLFDVGHGAGSFLFNVARRAIDQGFLPDSISSDLYTANINGPVYDMPTTMSKLLYLGLSFDDVLLRSTANPAQVVDRVPGMGTLQVGGPADIALLEIREGQFKLVDAEGNRVTTDRRIFSRLTICRGKRLVDPV